MLCGGPVVATWLLQAPSRGNVDAVNVHPVEFVSGEFLHLGCIMTLNYVGLEVHAATIVAFILIGGVLASLNHTRADVRVPPSIFDVRCVSCVLSRCCDFCRSCCGW